MNLEKLVFIDESGAKTNMTRLYGRAKAGQRVVDNVPSGRWCTTTMISSVRLDGSTACMVVDGTTDKDVFQAYVQYILLPTLKPGDIVILDNLSAHKNQKVRDLIESVGAEVWFLPSYSPDLNPIEKMWSKIKAILRTLKARTEKALINAIAEALESAGYTSCHIGKWHLGTDDWYPDKQGFDYNIGGCDFGQPPNYFDPYFRKGQGDIPTLKPRRKGEYLTDREGDEAVGFIRKSKDNPFFLYMAHYAVHTPIQAKKDLTEKYSDKPRYGQKNPAYAAMIESVDDAVGKICSILDELKLTQNTLVIFTSDNGGLSGVTNNAPLRAGKGFPYEGGIRVPVIIRWPGVIKPGMVSHEPVTSVDYFPTICEIAGVTLAHDRAIDGTSLVEHLKSNGTGKLSRQAIFWHFPHYRGGIVPYSIIREGDWKLIKRYEGRTFELFNLKADLSETNDLSEEMPEKVRDLEAKLNKWLRAAGAKLPKPNPAYQPGGKSQKKSKG